MSDADREDHPEQTALVELWRTLNLIAAELRQSHNSIPTTWKQAEWITRHWSCVFHGCGTLAGCVESWLMPKGWGKAAISFDDYCRVRRMALIGADMLPEDQWNVVGFDYDDADWEARARDANLNLPRLKRAEKYGTEGYAKLEADSQWFGVYEPSEDSVEINEMATPDVRFVGSQPAVVVINQEDASHAHDSLTASVFADDVARELESLARLRKLASSAEVAVKSLPRAMLNELNASTENGWKGRLIRDVVEPLSCWPIPGRDFTRPIPTTAQQFVECFAEHNPVQERAAIEAAALRFAGELAREYTIAQPYQELAPTSATQPAEANSTDADSDGIVAGSKGWSRVMTKAEAGRLLGGTGVDDNCRKWLVHMLDGRTDVMEKVAGKYRF
jgi:hypothetical protein